MTDSSDTEMAETTENQKKALKVFIVDDSAFARKSMTVTLEQEGYDVVGQAASADEATKAISNVDAHVFIIDVVMPETSGVDLAKGIKKGREDSFIIMVSSLSNESVIVDSISAGAVDFLQKPFSKRSLVESLERIAAQINFEKA